MIRSDFPVCFFLKSKWIWQISERTEVWNWIFYKRKINSFFAGINCRKKNLITVKIKMTLL